MVTNAGALVARALGTRGQREMGGGLPGGDLSLL